MGETLIDARSVFLHPIFRASLPAVILWTLLLTCFAAPRPARAALDDEKAKPVVGVFAERGFPNVGGFRAVSPDQLVSQLNDAGLLAETISAQSLADSAALTRYAAIVMPYGNAFPADAFDALRKFHSGGGILVLNGVPFCHPSDLKNGAWKSRGHTDMYHHAADGMGTGSCLDAEHGELHVATPGFTPNPLGLKPEDLPVHRGATLQPLDLKDLPPTDSVTPILELEDGPKKLVAAAIIQHHCPEFAGAMTVWLGGAASQGEEESGYLATQLVVRSVAWSLHARGLLSETATSQALRHAASLRKPSGLPAGLEYRPTNRSWGTTFLPKSEPPARRLIAVDVKALSDGERLALSCLQGLTSRTQPQIWLINSDDDRFWLDWHVQKGYIDGYDLRAEWKPLFKEFGNAYRGAVIPDPSLCGGELLAANVAACDDLIVASPELAKTLGLTVVTDLRGRFKTFADGLEWIATTYKSKLNPHLGSYVWPGRLANTSVAYEIQWRGLMFWITGSKDATEQGADPVREKAVVATILSQMPPEGVVLGFPYGGSGVGIGEPDGVELLSRYGKSLVCTDHLSNLGVTSGVKIPTLKQPAQLAAPKLDPKKIYIALAVSDGDNENVWRDFMRLHYFEGDAVAKFPLAFGIGPAIVDVQPAVAQWYYEHAAPDVEFLADVSGVGYMQPQNFGTAFRDQGAALRGFLKWTRDYLRPLDLHTLRTVEGSDEMLEAYAHGIPELTSIFADMGRYSGREGIANLTYRLPGGTPVFRAVTGWRNGAAGFLPEVREQVGKTRPAFVNGFLHCWTFDAKAIQAIHDRADPDMVFVTPSELADLYQQANPLKR